MPAELAAKKRLELLQREAGRASAQFDEGLRRLATIVVGNANSARSPSSGDRCAMRVPAFSAPKKLTG